MHSSSVKKKYQIFTPESTVRHMISLLRLHGDLYGRSFLENSCGDGCFLIGIVKVYVESCLNNGHPWMEIVRALERDIVGYDLDGERIEECRKNLDKILCKLDCPFTVKWNLRDEDFLRAQDDRQYDYVIGNPPYLSYWDIPEYDREYVKNHFMTCTKGLWDYCFAFIEKSIAALNKTGKLCYVIPSSIFKTKAAQSLRNMLRATLSEVAEYSSGKVFDGVLTSVAVIVVSKNGCAKNIRYRDLRHKTDREVIEVSRETLAPVGPWIFALNMCEQGARRFGDYFKVSLGVATLCNAAFVLKGWSRRGKFVESPIGCERIEYSAVRHAASPRGCKNQLCEYIIFPYRYDPAGRKFALIDEETFLRKYPKAYSHLQTHKAALLKRDADASASWYGYGRSQALGSISGEKLLLSQVLSGSANVHMLQNEQLPYSGYYIQPLGSMSLQVARQVLSDARFASYAKEVGVAINGISYRLTVADILNYTW